MLWRLENYPIQRLHPRVAVVLIGTNNTRNTAPEIADGVKAVLTKTQAIFPGVKIILVSIMPNARANDLMMSANTILRTFADDNTIYYLDLMPLMVSVGDNWKGLGEDRLHPDEAGYQLWADALVPLVNKLLPLPVQPTASSPVPPTQPLYVRSPERQLGGIAAIAFSIVPTLICSKKDRRRMMHSEVTLHPTSAWVTQQLREAFPTIPPRSI